MSIIMMSFCCKEGSLLTYLLTYLPTYPMNLPYSCLFIWSMLCDLCHEHIHTTTMNNYLSIAIVSGTREWSIENRFLSDADEVQRSVPNNPTKLLKDFRPDQSWTLQPGDMLYIPPRIPHKGKL